MISEYTPEQRFVTDAFQRGFDSRKEESIVLYGIGKNTEAILCGTAGFHFAGLMDQASTGKIIYGQKVLSDAEVIQLHPIIVIIARQSVVNIIFQRIRYLAVEYGISIYDFQGRLLKNEDWNYENEKLPYWKSHAQELMELIKCYDVITFDIFDTLLMRRVLLSTDVWELMERKLQDEGYKCSFASMRQAVEAMQKGTSCLDDIYARMQEVYSLAPSLVRHMEELECELDASLLLRREMMCRIFQFAIEEGKEVYLLSDMYYPQTYLEELLRKNGIRGYRDLFISCEVKKEKSDGSLFRWFRDKVGEKRILHIGDNRRADVEMAEANGIDAYQIYSAYELLMASSLQNLLINVDTLQKRCILGLVAARLFNNPFVLHASRGYLSITDIQEMGYGFVAPMLVEFTRWFHREVKQQEIEQLLYPSRDGYLMEKLYRILYGNNPETVYFRASRRALTVAGLSDASDIEGIAVRGGYRGTCEGLLMSRFGIKMPKTDLRSMYFVKDLQNNELHQLLKDYEAGIQANAKMERKQYVDYLQKKGLGADKKQAIFDFVAGGTVQYYLSRLLHRKFIGLYFATMDLPNHMYQRNTPDIKTAYGNFQYYGSQDQLSKHFLVLESILVDNKNSFSHINPEGEEVFEGSEENEHYPEIKKLQDAVLEFAEDYKKCFAFIVNENEELAFADIIFGMLFSKQCIVEKEIRNVFTNEGLYDGDREYSVWSEG